MERRLYAAGLPFTPLGWICYAMTMSVLGAGWAIMFGGPSLPGIIGAACLIAASLGCQIATALWVEPAWMRFVLRSLIGATIAVLLFPMMWPFTILFAALQTYQEARTLRTL